MTKLIFVLIIFLLFVWRVKKGFQNGIMQEVVNILSGVVALISVALIFFAVSSYMMKAMSTLTLCIAGLILVGIAFKICRLIFSPLLALGNLSVIGWLNKLCGAVMGAAEAFLLSYGIYYVLDRLGVCIL